VIRQAIDSPNVIQTIEQGAAEVDVPGKKSWTKMKKGFIHLTFI
jgi:hypothetical protein